MNWVSLIFTVHDEQGSANAQELHEILLRLQPQVIFLEIPAAAFDDFYVTRTQGNLESTAVNRFKEGQPQTKIIPIDRPTPPREFFEDFEYLRMRVRATSPRYRQLVSLDLDRVRAYGFAYLNSEYCSEHWSQVHGEISDAVTRIGEPRLNEIQQAWNNVNQLRELEMMAKIRTYCQVNSFETGALLVGAAHRRRLIEQCTHQSDFSWTVLEGSGGA